jgi:hypothetical protein
MGEIVERPASQLSEEWMFLVFVFCLSILAYLRYQSPSRLKHTWRSTFSMRYMRQVIREESNPPKEYLLLALQFALVAGLAVYCGFKLLKFNWLTGFPLYAAIVGVILILYPIKAIVMSIVQWLAHGDFSLSEYRYITFLVNRFVGIILLPFVLFIVYLPINSAIIVLYVAFGVLLLSFSYRIIMGLINALRSNVGAFYIFFYICTLEILPLLVLTKLVLFRNPQY